MMLERVKNIPLHLSITQDVKEMFIQAVNVQIRQNLCLIMYKASKSQIPSLLLS